MKDHPHCYHIDFAHETETCCWCSEERKLRFGQGQFDRDVGMATPLLSTWWWRYNPKMVGLYQQVIKQSGTPRTAHGPYGIHHGFGCRTLQHGIPSLLSRFGLLRRIP